MRNILTSHWDDNAKLSLLKFFVEIMSELTFDYTLIYFKPSTSTIFTLANECKAAILLSRNREDKKKSALHLLKELRLKISKSSVFSYVSKIEKSNYLDGLNSVDSDDTLSMLNILLVEFSPFKTIEICILVLKNLLLDVTCKEKKLIYNLTCELVSMLLSYGMGKAHIYKQIDRIFKSPKFAVTIPNSLDEFFKEILPLQHNFTICFRLKTPITENIEESREKLSVKLYDTFPSDEFIGVNNYALEKKSDDLPMYALVEDVKAFDPISALKEARKKVKLLHDVFKLFHHKSDYVISEDALIKQCCKKGSVLIRLDTKSSKNIADTRPKFAANNCSSVLSGSHLAVGKDKLKFFSALEFHGISTRSEVIESQITGLWTALESFSPKNITATNISNVSKCVVPVIVLSHVEAIIRNLYKDLKLWNSKILNSALKKFEGLDRVTKNQALIRLLVDSEAGGSLQNLLAALDGNDLLRFRLFEISKMFLSPKKLVSFLREIEEATNNELRRIYRARNDLIHSGFHPINIESIYEISHYYFDEVFNFCIEMSFDGFSRFDDIFKFAEIHCVEMLKQLSNAESFESYGYSRLLWKEDMDLDVL
ncbi:MAG: hypothetical protein J0L55_12155 [Caulobacterales bacterium]|nr:hypothetical protein [Caulobacterales bacterium]MCA0373036.1 hypothetical protein [Pseudomonadota bacterium]